MKKFLTLLLVNVFFIGFAAAQGCQPDPMFADSSAGVYPAPFEATNSPNGGISESACINQPFYFNFTIVVSETISFLGATVELDSIVIEEVTGVPVGLGIPELPFVVCNPGNCSFPANSQGCAAITGTATDANMPGDYNLVIEGKAYLTAFGPQDITFPGSIFPGEYILTLEEENSGTCFVGTKNPLSEQIGFKAVPNPTNGQTIIEINALIDSPMQFSITDMMGQVVRREMVDIHTGENQIAVDAANLPAGIYVYSLSNETGSISKKLVVR